MKIFVAIPVYDGKLQHQTVSSLMFEQQVASQLGDEIFVSFIPNCSHPAIGRNQLVQAFLDSSYDRLVFLDSDISFEPGALIRIARQKKDFVAGCTRHKTDAETYPIGWIPNRELQWDEDKHLEIAMIGTAFVSLSRNLFKTLKEKYPGREFNHYGKDMYCYFQTPFEGGSLYGEDTYFCKEWRAAGGKIFLNPELEITHWDFNKPYVGHIGKWLRSRMEKANDTEKIPVLPLPQGPRAEDLQV